MSELKYANDLMPTDLIRIGGMLCKITSAERNSIGGVVVHCYPIGSTKRNSMTLIVPKNAPFKTHNK